MERVDLTKNNSHITEKHLQNLDNRSLNTDKRENVLRIELQRHLHTSVNKLQTETL